jgi:hypothetical protein
VKKRGKMRAQVTLFVIIAILIVAAAGISYYSISQLSKSVLNREQAVIRSVPEKFRPAEINFMSCLKQKAQDSLNILGSQAGYINLPAEDPASDYMPFSNNLDFLGLKMPYWWYVSGNNLQRNQVPSLEFMKSEIETYMNQNIQDCQTRFGLQDFELAIENPPKTTATINDNYVNFEIEYPVRITSGNAVASVQTHSFVIPVQLGKIYRIARQVMDKENKNYFIEERTIDAIFLYPEIPSTSINFECSPKIWTKPAVEENVKKVIVNNIPFIKIKGTNYEKAQKYFEIDVGKTDLSLRTSVIPLTEPFKFEVIPSEGNLLKGQPAVGEGENEALDFIKSIFCLSSYHFVYTVGYPVVIQISDNNGYLFQYPVLILVANNQPKENRLGGEGITVSPELCQNKLAKETVKTFSIDNGKVDTLANAEIGFKCISTTCDVGMSEGGTLTAAFPQCVNGFLLASKEGYHPAKYMMSTNFDGQEVSLMLEKYNNFTLNILVIEKDGTTRKLKSDETVVVDMNNAEKEHRINVIYPGEDKIKALQGNYSVKLSLFEKGSFKVDGKVTTQCTTVPKSGIFGFLGLMEEKCFDFETPALNLEQVFGGGAEFSIDIEKGNVMKLYLLKTDVPKNVDELDAAYTVSKTAAINPLFKQPEIK